jgi:hypothetical protein
MRGHDWSGLEFWNQGLSQQTLDPGRAHNRSRFVLESVGQIDDVGAGVAGDLPALTGRLGIGDEKAEVNIAEFFRTHFLDEGDFVTQSFEFAQGFVVIQKLDVQRGKIAVA